MQTKSFGKSRLTLRLFKYVDDLEQAVLEKPPDILGMSNYPWNFSLGLEFFRMTRAVSPDTICVMGGPNMHLWKMSRGPSSSNGILRSTSMLTWKVKKHLPP